MKCSIIISGYGGQGVVLAGSLIANAALEEGMHTCGMISYGAEMRGGTANSSVIISDKEIGSPVVLYPDTAIVLNQPSLDKFEKFIKKDGLLIINSTECKTEPTRRDLKIIKVPATEMAKELGNVKAANLIMVGAYLKNRGILKLDSAIKRVKNVLPKANDKLIELNIKALKLGYGD